jgi:hypothetical protein
MATCHIRLPDADPHVNCSSSGRVTGSVSGIQITGPPRVRNIKLGISVNNAGLRISKEPSLRSKSNSMIVAGENQQCDIGIPQRVTVRSGALISKMDRYGSQ